MHPNTHPFIRFIMGSVSLLVCVHTRTYFVPMANVTLKSRNFKTAMQSSRGIVTSVALARADLRSYQMIKVKPCGVHTISHVTVLNIFTLCVGYLQLIFQL
jgi:hypothetical protein